MIKKRFRRNIPFLGLILLAFVFSLVAGRVNAQDAPPQKEGAEQPPAQGEAPPSKGKTPPPPEGETPPPEGETPPPEGETPPPEGEAPLPAKGETPPPPEGEAPTPEGEAAPPSEEAAQPPPEGETPVPEGETSPKKAETPIAEGEQPKVDDKPAPKAEKEKPVSKETQDQGQKESDEETEDKLDILTISELEDHLTLTLNSGNTIIFKLIGYYALYFNVVSDDYSANDWLSYYLLRLNADITKYDQLSVRMDLEQKYIADPGENGLWFGDLRLYYSRKFVLPIPKFPIPGKASVYFTLPTSRTSIERSYGTKPTAMLRLVPSWGPLTLLADFRFRYSIARYAESNNEGDLNTMLTTGYYLWLIYSPVDWFAPHFSWQQEWNKSYMSQAGESQPWLPNYRFEFSANFAVPLPKKWPTLELSLAYTQGAPTIDDGVYRTYFGKRDQSQIYLGITIIY